MGGAVSAGEDNDDLVDNLVRASYIRSDKITEVFRAVDRGHYYLKGQRNSAYYDIAWKFDHLHLSAPCIYSEVMEHLDLRPGISFLNMGSGTGYLSTMAGLVLGPNGINHGIEIHSDVVEYAKERLKEFIEKSPSFDKYDFCHPQFKVGNCLLLPPDTPGYDRIYCGAACPPEYANYLMNLLNIGGKLVLPLEDQVKIRTSINHWDSSSALAVSFAQLILPDSENKDARPLTAPTRNTLSLKELCRFCIRRTIREAHKIEIPKKKRKKRIRRRSAGVDEPLDSRHAIFHFRRRRINTVNEDFGSRRRRRVNTSGDSDHYSSSDSDGIKDSDEEREHRLRSVNTDIPDTSPDKEMTDGTTQNDLANGANDITLSDADNEAEAGGKRSEKSEDKSDQDGGARGEPSGRSCTAISDEQEANGAARGVKNIHSPRMQDHGFRIRLYPRRDSSTSSDQSASDGRQGEEATGELQDSRSSRHPIRVSRPARFAYALMQSMRRRRQSSRQPTEQAADNSEPTDTGQLEREIDEESEEPDEPEEPEDVFPPLSETSFTTAIRKLPFPPSLINYLLYYRQ